MKYRISWTEYHSIEVEAEDEDEAYDKAHDEGHDDTMQDLTTTEVKAVLPDRKEE